MRRHRVLHSPELVEEILARLSGGESLHRLCQDPRMPSGQSIRQWAKARPELAEALDEARQDARRGWKGGRPPRNPGACTYSEDIARAICEEIAAGGTLDSLAERRDLPSRATIYLWLRRFPEFAEMYAAAREARIDLLCQEAIEIADSEESRLEPRRANIRIGVRKWGAGFWARRLSADPPPPEKPLTYEDLLDELLREDEELRRSRGRPAGPDVSPPDGR